MKSIHNDEYKVFIDLLKEYRTNKNLSQGELAERLGWANHSYVSKYEIYERRLDVIEFRNVCLALGVSPVEFMKKYENQLKELNKDKPK